LKRLINKIIDDEWIWNKMEYYYGASLKGREFFITYIKDNYGTVGTIFFSINGSPPKGYALYSMAGNIINFYNNAGKRISFFIVDGYKESCDSNLLIVRNTVEK